jgi:enterochelin esterase family protein
VNDVPRGAVTHHFYRSAIVGDARDYWVYTPPGYDPRRARPYPVLYLLHGMSDDASAWIRAGRAHVILDNLIARRQAEPMLVVMTLGYGAPEIMDGGFWGRRVDSTVIRRNVTAFVEALRQEVIPQVERAYHATRTREGRAVAGLSMGGGQALAAGLGHPETFAWVGAFSSATNMLGRDYAAAYPTADARLGDRMRLLWIGVGRDDFLHADNVRFHEWLASRGVRHEWAVTDGAHTWMVWRRYLTDFAPRLFR